MVDMLLFGLISLGLGLLFSIPSVVLGFWLERSNIAPNRFWLSLLFCIVLVFVKRIWFPDLSYYWLALIVIMGSTIGVYRMDIYWAINNQSRRDDSNHKDLN